MTSAVASTPAEVVDAHEAAEAAHDADAVARTFAADGVLDPKPTGTTISGHEAIAGWYTDLFTAFPDIAPALMHRYQAGNVVIDEVMFSGTHLGTFVGIPATGKAVSVAASIVYETSGGAVVRESAYWDVATMLVQMGVLPPPGA